MPPFSFRPSNQSPARRQRRKTPSRRRQPLSSQGQANKSKLRARYKLQLPAELARTRSRRRTPRRRSLASSLDSLLRQSPSASPGGPQPAHPDRGPGTGEQACASLCVCARVYLSVCVRRVVSGPASEFPASGCSSLLLGRPAQPARPCPCSDRSSRHDKHVEEHRRRHRYGHRERLRETPTHWEREGAHTEKGDLVVSTLFLPCHTLGNQ